MKRRCKGQYSKIKIHIFRASFSFFFFFKDDYNVEGEKACLLSVRFTKSVMKAADLKCISCHLLSLSLTVQYLLIFWEWQCWDPSKPRLYANCHRVLGISLGLTSTAAVTTGNCSQLSSELKLTCRSPHSTMGEVSPTSNGQLMNYVITARESYLPLWRMQMHVTSSRQVPVHISRHIFPLSIYLDQIWHINVSIS